MAKTVYGDYIDNLSAVLPPYPPRPSVCPSIRSERQLLFHQLLLFHEIRMHILSDTTLVNLDEK